VVQRLTNKLQPADLSSLLIWFFLFDPKATWSTRRAWCSASPTSCNLRIYRLCLSGFSSWPQGDLEYEKGVVQRLTKQDATCGFIVFAYLFFLLDPRVTWIMRRAWCSASPTKCNLRI
jgi:hypothetical protein